MCSREQLERIRKRPRMYFLTVTWSALSAYIYGTGLGIWALQEALGLKELPPTFNTYNWTWESYFNLWAQQKYDYGPASGYHALIRGVDQSDEAQFHRFFHYLDEFEQEMESRGREIVLQELEQFKAQSHNR